MVACAGQEEYTRCQVYIQMARAVVTHAYSVCGQNIGGATWVGMMWNTIAKMAEGIEGNTL